MIIERHTKKPVTIVAAQLRTEADCYEAIDWIERETGLKGGACESRKQTSATWNTWEADGIFIKTLEGPMKANIGDWVIRGVQGEFYPCKPDIFEATYDRAAE